MRMKGRYLVCLVFGLLLCQPGRADIFVFTDADGAVSLSNVPTDDRYTVLIAAQKQEIAAVPVDNVPKSGSVLPRKASFDQVVEEVSRTYGLESALLHAVISVESHYNPKAVSKKGAIGLMQLMPGTAKRYGVVDAFDPLQNLNGGAHYLRDLLTLFNSDVSLALAAFNAGEHAVAKYGNRLPPYRETVRYVPKVLDFYQRYRADAGL
jgi:soluble lytic murein transglycosylase-like protein